MSPGPRRAAPSRLRFLAPCPQGVELVLQAELEALELGPVQVLRGAVSFEGDLGAGYRACLWSRVASRVLVQVGQGSAVDADALYDTVAALPWDRHLDPSRSLAVDVVGGNEQLHHSGFAARRVKDAICDVQRAGRGERSTVDLDAPDLRVHAYIAGDRVTLSVDLAGPPLHLRSAGVEGGAAPLKETLAAALLRIAGWPEAAARGLPLVDPMCGSGTFLREGVAMAAGLAPGLARPRWGFQAWGYHEPERWAALIAEARARALRPVPPVFGYDADRGALALAREGLERLGLGAHVQFAAAALSVAEPPTETPGLLVVNPPYGERLLSREEAGNLMGVLGDVLRRRFLGWTCWILAGGTEQARHLGLRPSRRIPVWNGRIECRWLQVPIAGTPVQRDRGLEASGH